MAAFFVGGLDKASVACLLAQVISKLNFEIFGQIYRQFVGNIFFWSQEIIHNGNYSSLYWLKRRKPQEGKNVLPLVSREKSWRVFSGSCGADRLAP